MHVKESPPRIDAADIGGAFVNMQNTTEPLLILTITGPSEMDAINWRELTQIEVDVPTERRPSIRS